jgi:hypothetical protein
MGVGPDEDEEALARRPARKLIGERSGGVETAWTEGRMLEVEAALELATA